MPDPADAHNVGSPRGDREGQEVPTPAERREAAAKRALAEAAERRAAIDRHAQEITAHPEQNGRGGLEPVRYDDWEIDGRAVDF